MRVVLVPKIFNSEFLLMKPFFHLFVLLVVLSCKKNDSPNPLNQDFPVTGTWQCSIDGVPYNGTIDTSFLRVYNSSRNDSIIYLTGSSADGKANLSMGIELFRTGAARTTLNIGSGTSYLALDTGSIRYVKTGNPYFVQFEVEGQTRSKFKGSFSGQVAYGGSVRTVSDGKISLELGKGTATPKFTVFRIGSNSVAGPVVGARHRANSLLLDGFSFSGDTTYKLVVRTGAAIKPGTYHSTKGEVGLQVWRPSITTHHVSDQAGDVSVTIHSISNNVVSGSISGTVAIPVGGTVPLSSGSFRCRVANYQPGTDAVDQWRFNADNNGQEPFSAVGGNITSASLSQYNGRYFLAVNGTTDGGRSTFRLNLSSITPFTQQIYTVQSSGDGVYLATPDVNYANANQNFFIRIDSISSQRVVGGFYGKAIQSSALYSGGNVHEIRKGYFSARF